MTIHPFDLAIVIVYVMGIVVFGFWLGRGQKSMADYMLGSRDLPWWAILGSVVATETSTATFLSVPGIAFAVGGDLRFLQLAIGLILGRVAVAFFLLPFYFRGKIFTAYQVLESRFGGNTQKAASLLFLITRNLGDGLRLFLTAIVLEKVAGIDLSLCIVLIGTATILYTFFGGMKAVVWNDCIQLVVYLVGGIAAGIVILNLLPGGWQQAVEFARTENKLQMFDFEFDLTRTYTFWSGLIGGATLSLGTHGTDQMMVQRFLSARSESGARTAVIASGLVVFFQFALFLLLGIGLACFYSQVANEQSFERNDEVFATFIVDHLPIGLTGLTLAAVFSAAMSTLSSSLNSSATTTVTDFMASSPERGNDQARLMQSSQWLTVGFGILQIGIGIAASYVSRSVVSDALALAGFAAGILLGVFALGLATKKIGQRSALFAMLFGTGFLLWLKIYTSVAWPWYSVFGATVIFVAGNGLSLIFDNPSTFGQIAPKQSLSGEVISKQNEEVDQDQAPTEE